MTPQITDLTLEQLFNRKRALQESKLNSGHLPFVDRPKMAFWRGIATYKILLFTVRIPEGGVVTLEKVESGTRLSHNVWMDFPDTLMGKIALWYFRRRNLEKAIYGHTFRELEFFKQQLEKGNVNST